MIAAEDKDLDGNLVILDEGTRARNRAYQERLDEVWRSTAGWEGKLRVERQEAEESIKVNNRINEISLRVHIFLIRHV